ncbi:proton-conducting transporter membrane subunit [Geminisphaera colitermitum]|uniref:complex I subunit 5 family protein n=1 Tax=Geminisphaera colitermitum TaxID=1148786 RepID=UPI000158C590
MAAHFLILIPFLGAALAAAWPGRLSQARPWLLPATAVVHAGLAVWLLVNPPVVGARAWIGFDAVARATLPAVSLLFLACSAYGVAYLRARAERPNRMFTVLLLLLLGLLSAGLQARHLGLLWIATEALTLATVPLLHFAGTSRAVEATWKYLLVGGTGIALSLLGSFALGYASLHGGGEGDLTFGSLMAQGAGLSRPWVLIAWVLLLVGYGTKMGLAPMHTWKPDAYGEAPGIVGAILAGGVTTVAFTALLRVRAVVDAAGEGGVAGRTLMVIGLFSMLVAALFLLGTRDFKRMLAYSSVEHMGILVIAASLGAAGVWAALFHVWTNGLTKGALFLSAGNMRRAAGTSSLEVARGMSAVTPRSAAVFVAGMFAVTACPPFGPFFSELRIVLAAFAGGHGITAGLFLGCLLFAFFGMSRVVFAVVDGRARSERDRTGKTGESREKKLRVPESNGTVMPALALLGLSLCLGLATPAVLQEAWTNAVASLTPQRIESEPGREASPRPPLPPEIEDLDPISSPDMCPASKQQGVTAP